MDGFTAESALTVALLNGPMFILSLGDRPAVGIVSTALYAVADTACAISAGFVSWALLLSISRRELEGIRSPNLF